MTREEFIADIQLGIPETLPELQAYDKEINHAPKRKDILTPEQKKLALRNALRYFPKHLHKDLALGIFNNFEENELLAEENPDFIAMYRRILSLSNERFRNSKVMLFLIIELVSSTAYTSIMYGDSLISLGELMPYLHETIHDIMERNRIISVEELPYNERNRAELKDN